MRIVRRKSDMRGDSGMTLLEVNVAIMIMAVAVIPLLVSLGGARKKVRDSETKRTLKQLMQYKLAHILLDKPAEDEEPLYVDGWEGNFGDDFDNDLEKAYWFDEKYYYYTYRVDSEEIDLGTGGGITGEEQEVAENQPPPGEDSGAAGSPFGGLGEEEEDLGQIRYRVTLFVFYRPGNANFDRHMSVVTYVRHPNHPETMQGPSLGAGEDGVGGGEAAAGAGATTTSVGAGGTTQSTSSSAARTSSDRGGGR